MKKFSFLALFTFISSALAQQQQQNNNNITTPFQANEDNYRFKTQVTADSNSGFTLEYKNYYKVVTNLVTNTKYCLVGWGQDRPAECATDTTYRTPVSMIDVDSTCKSAIPFIEILGLQDKLTSNVAAQNFTSPCITGNSTKIGSPDFTFSTQPGPFHVGFSADDDSIAPLEKAKWLLYVGAFFDMELNASAALATISNNYDCHKDNYASLNPEKKVISWTYYDPTTKVFTVRGDNYFTQLAQDASATLSTPNRLQNKTFTNSAVDLNLFAMAIQGSDFIIDESQPDLNYQTWHKAGDIYLQPELPYAHVKAIKNDQVYTVNGLVSKNNDSDWSQRSAARPDLALLELIKLFDPNFVTDSSSTLTFPIWLTRFTTMNTSRQFVTENNNYGSCSNMINSIASQSVCSLGGHGGGTYKQLSTGGKAGISVGAILFVLIASCLGIYLFRRYRRNKRHNFYRMNDL